MRLLFFLFACFLQDVFCHSLEEIYNTPKEILTLILMGDTQYYFKCEPGNAPCKKISKKCRENYGLDYYLRAAYSMNQSARLGQAECAKIENRYANRVQRQAIEKLLNEMQYLPAALILDGDLTDFGHRPEFEEFERGWLRNFRIPILAGLGNHDYDNNVDDCAFNFCAHKMLIWFTDYAKNMSLELDYERSVKNVFDITYKGSFAYSTRACSQIGRNCAKVIQLNNAVDYERKFTSVLVDWEIISAMEYLKAELNHAKDMDMPILINMHQCEGTRQEKLKELLGNWIYETKNYAHKKRVAVFFAHMHSSHSVRTFCFHDTPVPFVYVGSVPNNRFTFLSIDRNSTKLYGLATRDSFEYKKQLELLGTIDDLWAPCTKSNQTFVPFRDEFSKGLTDIIWD